ncbi:hypothetical protein ACU42Y_21130 [Proteus mirabilis]
MKNVNPTHTLAWKALEDHFAVMKDTEMKTLFSRIHHALTPFQERFQTKF